MRSDCLHLVFLVDASQVTREGVDDVCRVPGFRFKMDVDAVDSHLKKKSSSRKNLFNQELISYLRSLIKELILTLKQFIFRLRLIDRYF